MSDLRGFKVSNFRPFDRAPLRGGFDLEVPVAGLILRGCTLFERDGKTWICWPAKPFVKTDGSKSWSAIVDFVDSKAKYSLQDEVLPIVLAAMAGGRRDRLAALELGAVYCGW